MRANQRLAKLLTAAVTVAMLATPEALWAEKKPARRARARRWATCSLEVNNGTPFRVLVHVNGVFWGWVGARQEFTFTGIPSGKVVVYGETQYAEFFWGPKPVECRKKASWKLSF